MSVTYGGLPLTAPNQEINRLIDLHGLDAIRLFEQPSWSGLNGRNADFNLVRDAKLGKLLWPRGASRWATGLFLATQSQLDAIRRIVKPQLDDTTPATSASLRIWDDENEDDGTEISAPMYLLSPWPLFQHDDDDSDIEKFWLLPFVDERYFWWWKKADITITQGTTTWDDLITSVMAGLGVTDFTADAIIEEYLFPHASLTSHFEYLPPLLDAIAYSVGRRIVRQLTGKVVVQAPETARTDSLELLDTWREWTLQGGSMATGDNAEPDNQINLWATAPASVTMTFPLIDITVHEEDSDLADATQITVNLADLPDTKADYLDQQQRTGSKLVRSTAVCWADSGTPETASTDELTTLVETWAADWYFWQFSDQYRMFSTIIPWDGTGMADYVEWSAWPELATRVVRPPLNDLADTVYHADPFEGICPHRIGFDDFFSARLDCRSDVSGTFQYSWVESEWLGETTFASDKSGGRYGIAKRTATVADVVVGDGSTSAVQSLTISCGVTISSGTWIVDGVTVAWDIDSTDLTAALTGITATGNMTDGWEFTWMATGAQAAIGSDITGLNDVQPTWPATEINNRKVIVPTIVWMKRGFIPAVPARIVITRTATDPSAWSIYLDGATGGSYMLSIDGEETTTLGWEAVGADVKAALEAALSGLSLSSFSGIGTSGSPWTFAVTGNPSLLHIPHTITSSACDLRDGSGFRFQSDWPSECALAQSLVTKAIWTETTVDGVLTCTFTKEEKTLGEILGC